MNQGTATDRRQDLNAAFWETHFNNPDIGAFLSEAVSELVDSVGGPRRGISWAITVLGSGEPVTLTAGGAPARAADEAQRSFDDGPARTAVRSGEFVSVGDTTLERRWPGYAAAAAAEGIGSLISVPLVPAEVFRAAVNLYAPWPHVFTSADITATGHLARQVSRTLRLVQQLAVNWGASADLSSAQLSRVLAGLALRTLVRDFGFSEEGALDYLRSAAGGPARDSAGGTVRVLLTDSGQGHEASPSAVLAPPAPPAPLAPVPHAGDAVPLRRRRRRADSTA